MRYFSNSSKYLPGYCWSLVVLSLCLAWSCETGRLNESAPRLTSEDYDIYSILIMHELSDILPENTSNEINTLSMIVISDSTTTEHDCSQVLFDDLIKEMPTLSRQTFDDFCTRNASKVIIERKLSIPINYELFDYNALVGRFERQGGGYDSGAIYLSFYRRFPGSHGIWGISAVGFDAKRSQALVFRVFASSGDSGYGDYIFLSVENGKWIIRSQMRAFQI